jgi:heme/copper-type cytochrome/quinol oxidase subunit 2
MKGRIVVVSKEDFILWRAKQQPGYKPAEAAGAPAATPAPADTTKTTAGL